MVSSAADERALDGAVSAGREVIDVADHGIGENERQIAVGVCQLCLGLGLDRGIDGKGDAVCLIDGGRLELLFGESIAGLESLQLQLVRGLNDLVELRLQPV